MTPFPRTSALIVAAVALCVLANPATAAQKRHPGHDGCQHSVQASASKHVPIAAMPTTLVCTKPTRLLGNPLNFANDALGLLVPGGAAGSLLGDAVGGAVGDAVGGVAKDIGESAMNGITNWVAGGVAWVVDQVYQSVRRSTTPTVTAEWFKTEYAKMLALAGALAVPILLLAGIAGLFRSDSASILRAALVNLPLAFFITSAALAIVQMLLGVTDVMTAQMTSGFGADMKSMFKSVLDFLGPTSAAAGTPATPAFITLLLALLALIGSLFVWIELIIREAALYIVVLFLPLGCIVSIWPPAKRVARKLAVLLGVVIFSKFAILVIFAFGGTVLAKAGSSDGVTGVLAGASILLLASMAPMVLLKLLPFDEIDAVARPNTPIGAQMHMSSFARSAFSRGGASRGSGGPTAFAGGSGGSPGGAGGGSGGSAGGGSGGGGGASGAGAGAGAGGLVAGAAVAGAAAAKNQATTRAAALAGSGELATTDQTASPSGASKLARPSNASGQDTTTPSPASTRPAGDTKTETPPPPPHLASRRAGINLRELGSV